MCNFSTLLVIFVKDDLIGFVYGHKKDLLPATSYVTAFAHVDKPTGINRQMYGIIDLQKV